MFLSLDGLLSSNFLSCSQFGPALEFGVGVHGAAALRSAAVAIGLVGFVGVVEVVLVDQLFTGGDVADGSDEDATVPVFGLAVWRAGVVEEHGCSKAVDDVAVVSEAEDISDDTVCIALVGELFGKTGAVVLDDALAAGDGVERVTACGVDGGGADQEARGGGGFRARHWPEYSKGWGEGGKVGGGGLLRVGSRFPPGMTSKKGKYNSNGRFCGNDRKKSDCAFCEKGRLS